MTFTPDRRPMLTFGNAGEGSDSTDPWHRSPRYLADRVGWVRSCFDQARTLGFRWLRFHMPSGHNPYEGDYRFGIFRDQDANDEAYKQTERFTAEGGKVCLYTGALDPVTATPLHSKSPALAVLDPWIAADLSRIDWDGTSGTEGMQQLADLDRWAQTKSVQNAGEMYPLRWFGGSPPQALPVLLGAPMHARPWCVLHATAQAWDWRHTWRPNPATTEMRQMIWPPAFATPRDCIAYVRQVRAQGQIADQFETEGVDAAVTAEMAGPQATARTEAA